MNCAEIRLLLHAHADGELDVAHSLELERHLKQCAACAAEGKSLRSLRAALRGGDLHFRAPDALGNTLRQWVREQTAEPAARQKTDWQWLWKWLAAGATAGALLALFLRPGISASDELLNEAVASHVRSLQAEHLTDVLSSDQHTVKPWFDGKLDFAPEVRDFAAEGFPLVGGRLDYLDGRAVAALVYRHNKHFINVFVWPAGKGNPPLQTQTQTLRGYAIINRLANGAHYCLVSDLNAAELNDLAGLCAR